VISAPSRNRGVSRPYYCGDDGVQSVNFHYRRNRKQVRDRCGDDDGGGLSGNWCQRCRNETGRICCAGLVENLRAHGLWGVGCGGCCLDLRAGVVSNTIQKVEGLQVKITHHPQRCADRGCGRC